MYRTPPNAIRALGFDPEAVLLKEPGILLDPHFLTALHAELCSELGQGDANVTLLQMGFLHGLQDAMRIVSEVFEREPGALPIPAGPALAFQLRATNDAEQPGAIGMRGRWPERIEAYARLAALGESEHPACFLSAGYTSGWLSGALDADILTLESSCNASGAGCCSFVAREASAWREAADPVALAVLEALPFPVLRSVVRANLGPAEDRGSAPDRIGAGSSVVHIWGPVMVIPFGDGDAALNAVELIARDPAASAVSVVVVDLSGAMVDEAYGSIALEQLVEQIERWGAEAVFAAVSPLSEAAVAALEHKPLLVHKEVEEAIAAAFQLANAQRKPA